MNLGKVLLSMVFLFFVTSGLYPQVVINEGTNRNYSVLMDENGEYPDWIEIFNTGNDTVSLLGYSLSDDSLETAKWTFPNIKIAPEGYLSVFCSGKDRKPVSGFRHVLNTGTYTPHVGWNIHELSTPFYWDGISNILINTCSYSSVGYTSNSVFKQTDVGYDATAFHFQDGNDASCSAVYGTRSTLRPNMKLNGHVVGNGTIQNSPTDYPAPYGNWYWGARHQMLVRAAELEAAGLDPGYINSLAFNVVSTDPNTVYDYFEVYMKLVSYDELPTEFDPVDTNSYLHTNFKIDEDGEATFLFRPDQSLESRLFVHCGDLDNSRGSHPDASQDAFLFRKGTPGATNNSSNTYTGYLDKPTIETPSGFFTDPVSVTISNPNPQPSSVHYTTDGSEPSQLSPAYEQPFEINYSAAVKAKAFSPESLPSQVAGASYLFGADHQTPVLSVITANENLYGENGIFDNWWNDWERPAYVEYFDSTQQLIFSQRAGIQIDGGWGGARYHPQHSFRVELDDGVLGEGSINYQLIPDRPDRTKYSKFYLRNGSNQYLVLPYKDACQVSSMAAGTYNYYAAWRPVSVYINGFYFGLYELREKFDAEYFKTLEGADKDEVDLISISAWYGYAMRATEGSADTFLDDFAAFNALDPADSSFWKDADEIFDMTWYNDYIIGQSWMSNTDWPYNNIKIYRSDVTNYRWRFCLIDQELALLPNGWTDCYFDHIDFMQNYDPNNMYISIWQKGMQNERFHHYFINRFADLMNTRYKTERLTEIAGNMYDLTVVEMQNEYARWGDPNHVPEQMAAFTANHNEFLFQLSERSAQVRGHILSNFDLINLVDVTLDVIPTGAGKIHISTIEPEDYPWQGVYFNGVPVQISAVANDGFAFLNWGENGLIEHVLNPVFLGTLNVTDIAFEANFEDLATSTSELNEPPAFSIFPNPANNVLFVKAIDPLPGEVTFEVFDANGRIVMEGNLPGNKLQNQINIQTLAPGFYLLKLDNSATDYAHFRFVKL